MGKRWGFSLPKLRKTCRNLLMVLGLYSITFVTATVAIAQDNEAATGLDRAAIEKIVREYLLNNPEIMLEVQAAFEAKQEAQLADRQKDTIRQSKDRIFNGAYQIEMGNPEAKTTVVEFFDYNCGFCQRAMSDMQKLLEENNDIRFVLKEFPVLGESSVEASQVSMAFSKLLPEKHAEFHVELLGLEGAKDGNRAIELAVEMGADRETLETEMQNPSIIQTIQGTYELANALGITGTPSYVVGEEVIFGAVGVEALKAEIGKTTE